MRSSDILLDGLSRISDNVHAVLDGITETQLNSAPAPGANTIAWLVWHLTRVQDSHISEVVGTPEVWQAQGWYERFAFPFPPAETGYRQSSADAARVVVSAPDLLLGYYDATHEVTAAYLRTVSEDDLDRIVDTAWDPPVTLGVRLVSVIDDDAQHIGAADYLRGVYS